jgi:hypothetical protein
MITHEVSKGLIGLLVTDRDAALIPSVFECLSKSLSHLSETSVDMLVSLRASDQNARQQCLAHRPDHINILNFLELNYEATWSGWHRKQTLEAICLQRNAIRKFALSYNYDWLFFLDSDICLQEDTLSLAIATGKSLVHAPYQLRYSAHIVIGVLDAYGSISMLVNPHLFKADGNCFRCAIFALGSTLIRKDILHVPFTIKTYNHFCGEDVGYSLNLMNKRQKCYCLSHHYVEHKCQMFKKLFIPYIDGTQSFLISPDNLEQGCQNKRQSWKINMVKKGCFYEY